MTAHLKSASHRTHRSSSGGEDRGEGELNTDLTLCHWVAIIPFILFILSKPLWALYLSGQNQKILFCSFPWSIPSRLVQASPTKSNIFGEKNTRNLLNLIPGTHFLMAATQSPFQGVSTYFKIIQGISRVFTCIIFLFLCAAGPLSSSGNLHFDWPGLYSTKTPPAFMACTINLSLFK